jgi:hypothetical protein
MSDVLKIALRDSAEYGVAAGLAKDVYLREYGAQISPSWEKFAICHANAVTGSALDDAAVIGMSSAANSELFCDHYVGTEIQLAIGRELMESVDRNLVSEFGSFASSSRGTGFKLLTKLAVIAYCNGVQFGVVTATSAIVRILPRAGLRFVPLAQARESALPPQHRGCWGTYYETEPVVGFIDIRYLGNIFLAATLPTPEKLLLAVGA